MAWWQGGPTPGLIARTAADSRARDSAISRRSAAARSSFSEDAARLDVAAAAASEGIHCGKLPTRCASSPVAQDACPARSLACLRRWCATPTVGCPGGWALAAPAPTGRARNAAFDLRRACKWLGRGPPCSIYGLGRGPPCIYGLGRGPGLAQPAHRSCVAPYRTAVLVQQ